MNAPIGFRTQNPYNSRVNFMDVIRQSVMNSAFPGTRENTSVSDFQSALAENMQKCTPKITDQTDVRTVIMVGYAVAGE
jgi:hypothetical protein